MGEMHFFMSTKSTMKGKLEIYPVVVLPELERWVRPLPCSNYSHFFFFFFFFGINSGEEYPDSLNSVPSGTAPYRQHPNRKVGLLSSLKLFLNLLHRLPQSDQVP